MYKHTVFKFNIFSFNFVFQNTCILTSWW